MAYTTVPSKNSGDVWTEAMWDTSLRDNLNKGVMRALGDTSIGSDSTFSLSFSGFGADHEHLLLVASIRVEDPTKIMMLLNFNGDFNNNYDRQSRIASAAVVTGSDNFAGQGHVGYAAGADAPSGSYGKFEIWIPNYAETTGHKMWHSLNYMKEGAASGDLFVSHHAGFWRNASVIDAVTISGGTITAGSHFTLYGVAGI